MSQPKSGVVRRADAVERQAVGVANATEYQVLLSQGDGMPHFAMRRFIMGEGGGMPRHTNMVEHGQYVLKGRARVTIGDDTHEVGPGSVLYIPACHRASPLNGRRRSFRYQRARLPYVDSAEVGGGFDSKRFG